MAEKFLEIVVTPAVARAQEHYFGRAMSVSGAPECDPLTEDEQNFIAARDSFYMATVTETGWPYVQHRGGKPGFLRVINPSTLAFADYKGNRQMISTGNLTVNDRVALFLMDYPQRTRLKILDRARVEDTRQHPELVAQLAEAEARGIVERLFFIDVVSFDWNCPNPAQPEPRGWGRLSGMGTTNVSTASEPFALSSRYASQIAGQLSCFDRVIITGSLLDVCHPAALERQLHFAGIRCFDLGLFAEPLRDAIRDHAVTLARAAGLEVEFIQRRNFRKEDRVAEVLARRGDHPGLVHVFSAMEPCPAFRPWHDKSSGRTGVKLTQGKCLHFYFYFVHERLGLCYLRVPTWLPFRWQFYFNGHAWLANELRRAGIAFRMEDNAFVEIADWKQAQALADAFPIQAVNADLNALARQHVPFLKQFPSGYYWSLMQVEYSWDLSWKRATDLAPVYAEISRQAILTVKAPDVAKFLGKRLSPEAELTSDFRTRIKGPRIKHTLGPASLKLYDKRGRVLRLEGTANDVTFFKHYRKVEHRDGPPTYQVAALKKSLYSPGDLAGLMRAAGARYLAFLSALEDRSGGSVNLHRITQPARDEQHRSYRGFNFFAAGDLAVLLAIRRGEYQISGWSNRLLQRVLTGKKGGQISRVLKRLRLHGLIKKIGPTDKYYVTALGQHPLIAALKLKEYLVLPTLQTPVTTP